ncbi:MAG: Fur family transcriptional regulator [Chthoniobacterales bacterium]
MHFLVDSEGYKFTVNSVMARLRSEGMRVTKGRKTILEVLFAANEPLTLNEIQTRAEATGLDIPDYATVFRMIASLQKLGLVYRVNLLRANSYYELRDPAVDCDYLICRDCDKVIPLQPGIPTNDMQHRIQQEYGFSRLSHSVEFFGRCPECNIRYGGVGFSAPLSSSIDPDMRR